MSTARHDTDALAQFLARLRPDWNLGSVVTALNRRNHDASWGEVALASIDLAINHAEATAADELAKLTRSA